MTSPGPERRVRRCLRAGVAGLLALAGSLCVAAAAADPKPSDAHHKHHHGHTATHAKGAASAVPAQSPHGHGKKHASRHGAHAAAARLRPSAKPDVIVDEDLVGGTIRRGCAPSSARHEELLEAIGIDDPQLLQTFLRDAPEALGTPGGCIPFAVTSTRSGRVKALGLHVGAHEGLGERLYLFSRPEHDESVLMQTEDLAATIHDVSTITTTLPEVVAHAPALEAALPPEVLFGVSSLVPVLHASTTEGGDEGYLVRVTYTPGAGTEWARLRSVEIIERSTGRVANEALWVERDGMPGGFFGPDGSSYEHALWTTPVSFTRISRGIGNFRTTIRHRVARHTGRKTKMVMARSTRRGTHVGVDFAAPLGTPVVSVADGRVVDFGMRGGYGNLIVIEHAGGYTTRYAHLSAFAPDLEIGAEIRRGTEIGYVGSTGFSTGNHLHFEIRRDGTYLDPLDDRLSYGLWSMRSNDYLPMLRQSLITEATDRAAEADGGATQLDLVISGLRRSSPGDPVSAAATERATAGNP